MLSDDVEIVPGLVLRNNHSDRLTVLATHGEWAWCQTVIRDCPEVFPLRMIREHWEIPPVLYTENWAEVARTSHGKIAVFLANEGPTILTYDKARALVAHLIVALSPDDSDRLLYETIEAVKAERAVAT